MKTAIDEQLCLTSPPKVGSMSKLVSLLTFGQLLGFKSAYVCVIMNDYGSLSSNICSISSIIEFIFFIPTLKGSSVVMSMPTFFNVGMA